MLEGYARWLVRPRVAWGIVLGTLVFAVWCATHALHVAQDDDILAFLPASDPDIQAFHRLNDRFGSTDIALVGIPTADPFEPAFLERLRRLTDELQGAHGLDSVLSLTHVIDFRPDPATGGLLTDELVGTVPRGPAEVEALRARVAALDHVTGTLVSATGDAVLIYAFGAPGAQPREVAAAVREPVRRAFPDLDLYWGGGPFISTWIFETTQQDMARLTPWSVVAILAVLWFSFRDLPGTLLGLVATGIGLAASRAAMVAFDVRFNIVLGAMPIILFATGSAYAIHMLSDYNRQATVVGPGPEAVARTVVDTAPSNLIAGVTTMAGLGSLWTMDIEPLRTFGLFTALGVIVAMGVSLTFVPAMMALFPRPVRPERGTWLEPTMVALARVVRRHRRLVGMLAATGMLASVFAVGRVRTRMDTSAFFVEGSEPDRASRFLDARFGGSRFVQILIEGDLAEPEVLREVGRVGDRIRALPHVTGVDSVEHAVGLVGDAMVGARRVPDTRGQLATLYRFLSNDRASSRLVDDAQRAALLQVRIGASDPDVVNEVLESIEALVREEAATAWTVAPRGADPAVASARTVALVAARLGALAATYGVALPPHADARVASVLAAEAPPPPAGPLAEAVAAFLRSDESFVPLDPEEVARVAAAVAAAPDPLALAAAIADALHVPADDPRVADLQAILPVRTRDLRRAAVAREVARAVEDALDLPVPAGGAGERFRARLAAALQDREAPDVLLAGAGDPIVWTVNGLPVLYRGLSRSVGANQLSSFATALGTVFVCMTLVYRSVGTGVLVTLPTLATLLLVYGAMGVLGITLDIGTSMIAAMVLGDSVDYAVHTLHGWQAAPEEPVDRAAERGVRQGAHGVWTSAVMVAVGFGVLTLGNSRALQHVGALVGGAMLVAAFTTFVLLPLAGDQRSYVRRSRYSGPEGD